MSRLTGLEHPYAPRRMAPIGVTKPRRRRPVHRQRHRQGTGALVALALATFCALAITASMAAGWWVAGAIGVAL